MYFEVVNLECGPERVGGWDGIVSQHFQDRRFAAHAAQALVRVSKKVNLPRIQPLRGHWTLTRQLSHPKGEIGERRE